MTRNRNTSKANAVGINHVALEVGDIDAAIEFYGGIFAFSLRSRSPIMAEIDMGDQFLALMKAGSNDADVIRHLGLVVDDPQRVREALEALKIELLPGRRLDFRDPWGNLVQVVDYKNIQFMKTPGVLAAMCLQGLRKTDAAKSEIEQKGFAPQ